MGKKSSGHASSMLTTPIAQISTQLPNRLRSSRVSILNDMAALR
ncbi:hypothetical protein ATSB10_03980 [Dyella thiooxydans]|uniref:Uncharacterized protein n=1 Tax=Dyella thiooxydans TaxID=445710 RepID=A0A160MYV7_9GAMM|nr:hypothetical protein ATSB10_03980 [Dyella thiooxydans]